MGSLFKFGDKPHMEQLLEEGLLFMQTLKHFSEMEDGGLRGDRDEGLVAAWQSDVITVTFAGIDLSKESGLVGRVRMRSEDSDRTNVFCMYRYNLESAWVDPRNYKFGGACAIIKDTSAFYERVHAAFRSDRHFRTLQAGPVEYVDTNVHHGEITPFIKPAAYSYQHEYRIAVSPGLGAPYALKIGSLTDIGGLWPAGAINQIPLHVNLLPPKRQRPARAPIP
jgi:hypothetical protein